MRITISKAKFSSRLYDLLTRMDRKSRKVWEEMKQLNLWMLR